MSDLADDRNALPETPPDRGAIPFDDLGRASELAPDTPLTREAVVHLRAAASEIDHGAATVQALLETVRSAIHPGVVGEDVTLSEDEAHDLARTLEAARELMEEKVVRPVFARGRGERPHGGVRALELDSETAVALDREELEILSGHLDSVLQEIITARGRDVEEETRRLLTTLHDILAAAAGPATASTEAEPSVAPIPSDAESRIHDVIQRLRVLHRALYREIQGIKEQEEGGAELWGALVALDWTVDRLEAAVEAVYADGDLLRLESALMEASNLLAGAAEVLYQRSDALTEGTGLHHLVQDAAEALVALWEEYAGAWPEPAA